jgi:hypothetical protein
VGGAEHGRVRAETLDDDTEECASESGISRHGASHYPRRDPLASHGMSSAGAFLLLMGQPGGVCSNGDPSSSMRARQQVVLVYRVVKMVGRGERVELGAESLKLLRVAGHALYELLHRAD